MKKLLVALALSACAAMSSAAPSAENLREIKARLAQEGLQQAGVEFAADGRLKLTGSYRDRGEVQLAFNIAQQLVGVRWVAPTTPENVRYPGTENMKSGILSALRKSAPVRTDNGAPGIVHALLVGVGRYETAGIRPLPNAANDAKIFYNYLGSRNVRAENMTLLLEEEATRTKVAAALEAMRRRVKPFDTVILYFSTHGDKPNDLGNMAVVLHDSRVDTRRRWLDRSTALQDEEIKMFIESVAPARVMLVLDVCYSGAAFDKIPGFLAATSKDLFVEEQSFATGFNEKNLSYLAGGTGAQEKILVAASGPGERSWESQQLKQSYFTYYFVEELRRQNNVQAAFTAAKPIVQSAVEREVAAPQTPQASFIPGSANLKFER